MLMVPHRFRRATALFTLLAFAAACLVSTTDAEAAVPQPPFRECPAIGADTSCGLLLDVTNFGTAVLQDPTQGPYDGQEDTLVGVVNRSSQTVTQLPLSSPLGIFGFDSDGICSTGYPGTLYQDPGCPFGPTGYEGPGTSFEPASKTTGVVRFSPGIAPGGAAFFSLEESLEASSLTVPPPTAAITAGPRTETDDPAATFAFTGTPGGTFECQLDEGAWSPCESGVSFKGLMPGDHRFQVRQRIEEQTSPVAEYRWTVALPRACVLRVARARVFVFKTRDLARLVIAYKSHRRAKVSVSFTAMNGGRATRLGTASAEFKREGLFRLPEHLSSSAARHLRRAEMVRVRFVVGGAPKACGRYYTKLLTIPRPIRNQTVWFQSDSTFAPPGG
ncbi:MAG: hypothetical protein JST59_26485 [Actinobacteria bacterium]|nr:hypothetical protein [Actinomycetota bacterium]